MQRQTTDRQNWLEVETTHGTEWINIQDTSLFVRDNDTVTHPMGVKQRQDTIDAIRRYTNGEPQAWKNVKGFGARLSAPGYLDCTEWAVFETEEEANQYLDELTEDDEM